MNEENYNRLLSINEEATAKNAEEGTNWQKIGDFWYTAMDTTAINQQGIKPLRNHRRAQRQMGRSRSGGIGLEAGCDD